MERIERRGSNGENFFQRIEGLSKERIVELYTVRGMTKEAVAKALEISTGTVSRRMREYGIPTRARRIEIDRDYLYRQHIVKGLGVTEIALKLEVSRATLRRAMIEYDVALTKALAVRRAEEIRREVVQLSDSGEMTRTQICKKYNLTHQQVESLCFYHGRKGGAMNRRNKRIRQLHAEGVTIEELAQKYELSEDTLARNILGVKRKPGKKRGRTPLGQGRTCLICSEVFISFKIESRTCSEYCGRRKAFVDKCSGYLKIRSLYRSGLTLKAAGEEIGLSASSARRICGNETTDKHPWASVLCAIETLRGARGKAWLSQEAQVDCHKATRLLESEKLLTALKERGII